MMGVSTVHVLHGIKTPTQFYSQVEDATPQTGISQLIGTPSGLVSPMFLGVKGAKPVINFRTTQLATLLTETGLYGADLSAGNTDLMYRKVTNLGTREADASTVHTRIRAAKAFMNWRSLTARHQQEATAEATVWSVFDGTNVPLVATGSVALAGTPTAAEFFGLGPITINTVALPGDTEMSIDLGVELYQLGSGSETYDSFLAVKAVHPVITLRSLTIESWASYGLIGAPLTAFAGYLRKCCADAAGGVAYVADATAAHIKFSATTGIISVDQISGGGSTEASEVLKIQCRSSAPTAAPLTIATGQAIT
jgi:hypothetical protein